MKITIAYQTEEEKDTGALVCMIRHLLGKVKVKKTDKHKPFLHIYITKDCPATGTDSKKP